MEKVAPDNEEAVEAWSGVLFDRFVEYRHLVVDGLAPHGEAAIRACPPRAGDRALDIGCGFGDSSQRLGELVGPEGSVLGIDVAPRFIETARREAEQAGARNVRFEVGDAQVMAFDERFDYVYSRFGTMFAANPVVMLRNVRSAMAPGARLCLVVWRRKLDNPWLHRAETVVKELIDKPEASDEPTCGPGPFSMADADTLSDVLLTAGFDDVTFERRDVPFLIGRNLDEAVDYNMALGPAAEVLRLHGSGADAVRPRIVDLLHGALEEFATADGIVAASSTWIVTATAPASHTSQTV